MAVVGQLAAGMAHEFRNPLTSLKAILQIVESPAELTMQDLAVVRQEISRMENSVQMFLDFARPPQLQKTEIELEQLLNNACALVNRRAERDCVRLVSVVRSRGIRVFADSAQLRQVVLNLLLNSLDATPAGGSIRLITQLEASSKVASPDSRDGNAESDKVRISVVDDGWGLPEHLGDRVFEPFVTTKEFGIGLGLAISKRIVESHGGTLSARNQPEGGAKFVMSIPLVADATNERRDDANSVNR
jgi:signal transduction histidine kinase